MPDDPNNERAVFDQAITIKSPVEHSGYIRGACGNDPDRKMTSLSFSDNGSKMATGLRSGQVQVWDLTAVRLDLSKLDLDW